MSSIYEIIECKRLRRKVRAIITNERGEFLLIQPHSYEKDTWTLVGGGVENGESYEQAVIREITEETGIDKIVSIQLSEAQHWFCFSEKIKTQRKLDYDGQVAKIFWVVVPNKSVITLQKEEVRSYCWAQPNEVLDLIKVLKQKELVKSVIREMYELKKAA